MHFLRLTSILNILWESYIPSLARTNIFALNPFLYGLFGSWFWKASCKNSPGSDIQKQSSGGVLEKFAKFTRKHLRQSLFFKKVVSPEAFKFIKKETLAQVFSCEFCETFENTFSYKAPLVSLLALLSSVFKVL